MIIIFKNNQTKRISRELVNSCDILRNLIEDTGDNVCNLSNTDVKYNDMLNIEKTHDFLCKQSTINPLKSMSIQEKLDLLVAVDYLMNDNILSFVRDNVCSILKETDVTKLRYMFNEHRNPANIDESTLRILFSSASV